MRLDVEMSANNSEISSCGKRLRGNALDKLSLTRSIYDIVTRSLVRHQASCYHGCTQKKCLCPAHSKMVRMDAVPLWLSKWGSCAHLVQRKAECRYVNETSSCDSGRVYRAGDSAGRVYLADLGCVVRQQVFCGWLSWTPIVSDERCREPVERSRSDPVERGRCRSHLRLSLPFGAAKI